MPVQSWLRTNREKIEQDLSRSPERWDFSPAFLAQYRVLLPLIQRYVAGKTIDLGCGTMPFTDLLASRASTYHTLDLRPRSEEVTYVGDIQNMSMIPDESYDSALSLEVLEHVQDPWQAAGEIHRILRPGGILIVSVPHLSRLHEEPHDYFRFTVYGLQHLLETTGFEVVEIHRKGGLVSFLGHQVSTLLLSAVWPVAVLRRPVWFLNKWLVTRLWYRVDSLSNRSGIFALGYVAVARKVPVENRHPRGLAE
ncbi:MAG: class I SAM-dependent methyltransferase [Anaerolineae bacterium]|jgi:SAM-dependent methyltransferase